MFALCGGLPWHVNDPLPEPLMEEIMAGSSGGSSSGGSSSAVWHKLKELGEPFSVLSAQLKLSVLHFRGFSDLVFVLCLYHFHLSMLILVWVVVIEVLMQLRQQ
jgi:hypothetical protein